MLDAFLGLLEGQRPRELVWTGDVTYWIAGFDAIEAITPKPAGDLQIDQIRDLAAGHAVILWGGVPGVLFAPPFDWPQVEAHVRRLIESWSRGRFIMGVADQVPPDGDIDFCRRIAEMLR